MPPDPTLKHDPELAKAVFRVYCDIRGKDPKSYGSYRYWLRNHVVPVAEAVGIKIDMSREVRKKRR